MGYFRQAATGVSWISAFRISTRLISLLRTIVLARVLSPFYFGIYGIATLVLSLLEILTETGINVVLIQKKDHIDDFIDSAWVVSIARGIIISLLICVLSFPIANFFSSPQSQQILVLISLVPLIRGFINPATVKFQKDLKFSTEFWFRFVVFFADAATALIFSLLLRNAYGMVIGLIVGALLEVILSFLIARPIPTLRLNMERVKEVINKGKWITGAGIFHYLFRQGDDIVVGKLLGEASLGVYQVAYKVSTLPISEITDVFGKVVFPVYTKISSDRARLKRAFLKTTAVISVLALISGIVIFVFAPWIVTVVLGEQWAQAIPVLRVLALFGVIQAIKNSGYSLLLALEKNQTVIRLTFIAIVGLGASIIPQVLQYGVVGAAISALFGALVSLPFMIYELWYIFR